MEKEFVTYEQALALAGLGVYIPPPCYTVYRKYPNIDAVLLVNPDSMETLDIVAPLKQQVFRWFREKYNMLACVYSNASGFLYEYHDTIGGTHRFESGFTGDCKHSGAFTTYEKAENSCIDKLIELAKQRTNEQ